MQHLPGMDNVDLGRKNALYSLALDSWFIYEVS